MVTVSVGNLLPGGVRGLGLAFSTPEWNKRPEQYERYLEEQSAGTRDVLVAAVDGELAGYVTIRWQPDYPRSGRPASPRCRTSTCYTHFGVAALRAY